MMKVRSIFLLILFCCSTYCAKGQQIVQKVYFQNGQFAQSPAGIVEMPGNDLVHTSTQSIVAIANYHFTNLVRTDSALNTKWQKELKVQGGTFSSSDLFRIHNDSLIISGAFADSGSYDPFKNCLIKTDSSGNVAKAIALIGDTLVGGMAFLDNDSTIIIAGCQGEKHNFYDNRRMFIAALDLDFNLLWNKVYVYNDDAYITKIVRYIDNGFIVQAQILETDTIFLDPPTSVLVMRLDSQGNLIWAKRIGNIVPSIFGATSIYAADIVVEPNGNILCGIATPYFSILYDDVILQRLDSSGNELQTFRYGNSQPQNKELKKIIAHSNGNFILQINSNFFLEIDSNLSILNSRVISSVLNIQPTTLYGICLVLKKAKNGGFINWGYINQTYHLILARADSTLNFGCQLTVPKQLQQQLVSFPNIDRTSFVKTHSCVLHDSTITIQVSNINYLTDTIYCHSYTEQQEQIIQNSIKVFPSIAQDKLTVLGRKEPGKLYFKIYDLQGKERIYRKLEDESIDITSLPFGFYLLKIYCGSQAYNFKFIKQ